MESTINALQDWVDSLPALAAWLGVMLLGMIPYVESYVGATIGVIAGVPLAVAVGAAIIGNIASMLVFVFSADKLRSRVVKPCEPQSDRRQRLRRRLDRFGVPGVSLLGQTLLPSQLTSALLVSFGASRQQVVMWQVISITLWGALFGTLAYFGMDVLFR